MHGQRMDDQGRKSWCIASESVLLDILDFHQNTDLRAGEAIFIDLAGNLHRQQIADKPHSPCLFEWVYFARPDSFLDRVSVTNAPRLGESMAAFKGTGWADVCSCRVG
jgi:amidophosphoribosyltransferase